MTKAKVLLRWHIDFDTINRRNYSIYNYMENNWNFTPQTSTSTITNDSICRLAGNLQELRLKSNHKCRLPEFKKITSENIEEIWKFLNMEKGRTTDFSYGGILMWVDFFNYEYTIYKDTLFIKGVVENDLKKSAFSLPIGSLQLKDSINLLKEYCSIHNIQLEFSAVPEYALVEMKKLNPMSIEELSDWGDYLYDAQLLATVSGKKMSKKRNHVHQFESHYPDAKFEWMNIDNANLAMDFMDIFDKEGDSTEMAVAERKLSREIIKRISDGDKHLEGIILFAKGEVCAYTIGDVKGDTLFIHVEKATREVVGSYEMINYLFAKLMTEKYSQIKFINREDDAGDIGLRMAKESYHPIEILKKYNIVF